ncbi:caprin-2 isoform X14 [Erinaceus europaeus]|uniref:Caprin-2 isoform X14 n=1 Tax=Erinaceus europaeus TaxID=9365 RepID=A0ABM3XP46_ERIEU|nr:caprin-2 isoform X14 [Erinaceus europaeus]
MVQLSPSPLSSQGGWEGSMKPAKPPGNRRALSPPHPPLPSSASLSHTYETYVDNGLICLKHKIRNIEKKKLKLEDYKDRLKNGEQLNPDQLEAVEKYEEVLHNLEFAKELQKTFSGLSQDLLKAQRKAQRREHLLKLEAERKKLCTLLQVQYVLQSLAQEQVRADLREGLHGALCLPLQELDYLIQFSKLTCLERNESLSVEDQMEQSSLYFWDLLEGSEKAVVGTTYKHMKDLLSKLLHSGYFETIHIAKNSKEKEVSLEEEELIKPEPENQLLEIETVRESESLMEFSQAEIQPQEFLNRRYLAGVDYSLEQGQPSWEPGYAGRPSLSQCWEEACAEADDQEKREAWESPGKCQQLSKPDAPLDGRKRQVPALRSSLALPVERGTQAVSRPKLPPSQWEPDRPVGKVGGLPEDQEQHEAPQQPWPGQLQKEQEQELGTPAAKALGTWEKDASAEQKHPYLPSSQLAPKSWGSAPASLLPRKLATAEPKNVPPPLCQPAGSSSSTLPKEPVLRKKKLQDLMTQIQGTCNFMQDSDLDLDKPASVIPASQLPPASPSSPEASSEQSLASQSDFLQESLQPAIPMSWLQGAAAAWPSTPHQLVCFPGPPHPSWPAGRLCGGARVEGGCWLAPTGPPEGSKVSILTEDMHPFPMGVTASYSSRPGSSPEHLTPPGIIFSHATSEEGYLVVLGRVPEMRVAFSAARTSNLTPGTLDQPIVFDLLINNLGETFDLQLGRFACPVNGTYVFIFHMLKLAVNVPLYVNLMRNEEVLVSAYANDGAPDHETASNHAVLQLCRGDQIWLRLHRGAIYGSSWKYSTFSGYLLYQD